MRRKRRNTGNGVLIDLTSLLDVIFILLLVIICSYSYEKQKNEEAAVAAQESFSAKMLEAEANSKAYADLMDTKNNLKDYVWAASVVVPYEPDNITLRHIKVLTEDREIITIDLVGNDVSESIKEFKDSLESYVKRHPDHPVILSLNEEDDNILYRDEKLINGILEELAKTYNNVYIKG